MPLDRRWDLWAQHFPRRPPRVTPRYLESRPAHRLQEVAYGGLPKAVKEQLADCGERLSKIKVWRGACPTSPG